MSRVVGIPEQVLISARTLAAAKHGAADVGVVDGDLGVFIHCAVLARAINGTYDDIVGGMGAVARGGVVDVNLGLAHDGQGVERKQRPRLATRRAIHIAARHIGCRSANLTAPDVNLGLAIEDI